MTFSLLEFKSMNSSAWIKSFKGKIMESVNTPTGDDALKTAKRLIKETIPKKWL